MIAHIKVENGKIHDVTIPNGWYRLPKKGNLSYIKDTDMTYNPGKCKWETPTSNYPIEMYYAVIRKYDKPEKKKDVDINENKIIKYQYKDANRNWWDLSIKYVGKQISETEEGFYEGVWSYILAREDGRIIYKGNLYMQYDLVPDASCVMADIMVEMTHLSIGITKHQKDIIQ